MRNFVKIIGGAHHYSKYDITLKKFHNNCVELISKHLPIYLALMSIKEDLKVSHFHSAVMCNDDFLM